MRLYFLIVLALPLLSGCETNKIDALSGRFELVNGTLEHSISIQRKENDYLYQKVDANDQLKVKEVKDHSEGIVNYLNSLKDVLVEKSGGIHPGTNALVGSDNFDIPYNFISRSVYRRTFKDTVNSISKLITEMEIFEAPSIAIDGKDDPYWSKIPSQNSKSVIQLLFEGVNISGSLISISQLQQRVLNYERKAYETFLIQELDSLRNLQN